MKKLCLILFSAVVVLTSCAPKMQYVASSTYIDYQSYLEQGIYITESNSVNFDYTPLGSVSSIVYPGYVRDIQYSRVEDDLTGETQFTKKSSKWKPADVQDAIAIVVEKAKQQGGNGIINFSINPISETFDKTVRHGYIVTGMVIHK